MTERKAYNRTDSQKIQDEVRNKALHEDIAWSQYRAGNMREILPETKEYEDNDTFKRDR